MIKKRFRLEKVADQKRAKKTWAIRLHHLAVKPPILLIFADAWPLCFWWIEFYTSFFLRCGELPQKYQDHPRAGTLTKKMLFPGFLDLNPKIGSLFFHACRCTIFSARCRCWVWSQRRLFDRNSQFFPLIFSRSTWRLFAWMGWVSRLGLQVGVFWGIFWVEAFSCFRERDFQIQTYF